MMNDTQILVASNGRVAQVRVVGRGTFACSQTLAEYAMQVIASGVNYFLVDLAECPSMDSAFMGTLTKISTRLLRQNQPAVEVVNASEKNAKLLAGLGLKHLFLFTTAANQGEPGWNALAARAPANPEELKKLQRHILEAHEILGEADPENVPRFKNVIECLKKGL